MRYLYFFLTVNFIFISSCSKPFVGDCIKGDCQDGYGEMKWNNHTYKGDWENGKMQGDGENIWDDGGYEKGQYEGNYLNGYAEQFHGANSKFSGDTYKGFWKNDKYHGEGEYYHKSTQTIYSGTFIQGDTEGTGVLLYLDSSDFPKRKYEGEFKNNSRNGFGKEFYGIEGNNAFNSYEGEFTNDYRDGEGTYFWSDGSKFKGNFNMGKFHGKGTYWLSNGSKFEGIWIDGYCEEFEQWKQSKK